MEVLYQLSYVGTASNPSVPMAARATLPGIAGHGSWGVP
jgi:hypothetical protein